MIQLPENIRPYAKALAKYHFWLLAAAVPFVMLPTLFAANRHLDAEMVAARGQIETKNTALRQVDGIAPHPNEKWAADIDARTVRIKQETLAEWTKFWKSQDAQREWPAALGDDFVQRAVTFHCASPLVCGASCCPRSSRSSRQRSARRTSRRECRAAGERGT